MQMAEPKPVPFDALHSILVYLETERMHYEDTKDKRRLDYVYGHAATVRDWLSSVAPKQGPGVIINVVDKKDTET
jgi:hypothetical protein